MKLSLTIVPAALVLALAATPAVAQWERHHQRQGYSQRAYNRCVVDLGYGRYEYCN